jgi:hypothetical protein
MDQPNNAPPFGQLVPMPIRGRRVMARLKLATRVVRASAVGVVVESPPPRRSTDER